MINTLEKVKTVDVFALVDGEYMHIEMNTSYHKYLHYRNFNYFVSLYSKKTTRGEDIDMSSKFLHIDFTYGMGKKGCEKTEYGVISYDKQVPYIDNFKIIEYNMDKMMSFWYHKDDKNIQKYKHLIMLDLERDELEKLSKGDDDFMKNFEEKVTHLNDDDTFQSLMTIEEDRVWCFNTEKKMAIEEREKEIAKNMLQKDYNFTEISDITGLSKEEILSLQ